MTTYTNTIGTGGDYSTLPLFYGASATAVSAGDVLDAVFLSGTHDVGGNYNSFNDVDLSAVLRAHPSAMHNGDWGSGVKLYKDPAAGGAAQALFYPDNSKFDVIVEDCVVSQYDNERGRFGILQPAAHAPASADIGLTFRRCLLNSETSTAYEHIVYGNNYDVDPLGSPSAIGTSLIRVENCVSVKPKGTLRGFRFEGQSYVTNTRFEGIGSTFINTPVYSRISTSSTRSLHLSGCLADCHDVNLGFINQYTPDLTSSIVDCITSRTVDDFPNETNYSYGIPFNYDGTVTDGQVCFVGPSGITGDYRLVASEDNLASGYVSNFNLSGLDVAKNSRGDSPYDAGAFEIQSGGGEDFPPESGGVALPLTFAYRININD